MASSKKRKERDEALIVVEVESPPQRVVEVGSHSRTPTFHLLCDEHLQFDENVHLMERVGLSGMLSARNRIESTRPGPKCRPPTVSSPSSSSSSASAAAPNVAGFRYTTLRESLPSAQRRCRSSHGRALSPLRV
ncbi:hypothetical protein Cni_G06238 [Canna indica]|uniref:Uncharacterized protein n=1 Tax=Canna indica TaxID=4628 RepID=A0AAQ3Q3V5_9LILI|nr:hypothetical protein Cni_G06238 [Canna indica]